MSDIEDGDAHNACHPEWYTKRFWDALKDDRFLVGDCANCGEAHFPPSAVCPHCGASADMTEAAGTGMLYSFTRQHRTPPGFDSPVTIGTIELTEGPQVLMRVLGEYEHLAIGTDVEVISLQYEQNYDRGALSGYPIFAARPV